ncbi:MAG: recombination protein O N-terminal domain-containing protein [Nodosilinea sp. LVE1205-7]|jgi:DNA repair protein RecO (recombination protein O)
MSQTYQVTGINLKAMPLGESDRLLTILTPELGLVRAVAPVLASISLAWGGAAIYL